MGTVVYPLHCINVWCTRSSDEVEVTEEDDSACVAMAESLEYLQDGEVKCLTGRDLSKYDYISIGRSGFAPVTTWKLRKDETRR
jgi:hypothetical protein